MNRYRVTVRQSLTTVATTVDVNAPSARKAQTIALCQRDANGKPLVQIVSGSTLSYEVEEI